MTWDRVADILMTILGALFMVGLVLFTAIGWRLEFRAWRLRDRSNKRWWFTSAPLQEPEFFPTPEAQRRREAALLFYKRGGIALAVAYGVLYLLEFLLA